MAVETLDSIPASFRAGDTVKFYMEHSDYPASDGWALSLTFTAPSNTSAKNWYQGSSGSVVTRGQEKQTATGSQYSTTDKFIVTIAAGTSAGQSGAFIPGRWSWVAKVTLAGEVATLGSGVIDVLPDLSAGTTSYDARTQAQVIVEQCDAAILALSTNRLGSYSVAGRTFQYHQLADLRETRKFYAAIARQEAGKKTQTVEVQCV